MHTVAIFVYHDGLANENSQITLSSDPVFNNCIYTELVLSDLHASAETCFHSILGVA